MIVLLELALVSFLILAGVLIATLRDPVEATAIFAAFSLGLAIVWILLAAPDVALMEAAVGAGVVVIFLLVAAQRTGWSQADPDAPAARSFRSLNLWAFAVVLALALPMIATIRAMPRVGDPDAPSASATDPIGAATPYAHFVGDTAAVYEIPNAVTAVLLIFRGLDTFGEVVVVFTAVIGVFIVLDLANVTGPSRDEPSEFRAGSLTVMSPVGRTAVRLVVPLVFVFGVYLTLSGTVLPGGGFQGGVVMGASLILVALVFGHAQTGDWIDERALLSALVGGVLVFLGIVLGSMAFHGAAFDVARYPLPTILVLEVLEVAIGVLVGGVITALVFAIATGLRAGQDGGDVE